MRATRTLLSIAISLIALTSLSACSQEEDDGSLRLLSPGSTVFIDAWDQDGDKGDRALVEKKPSGMWVLPEDAPFSFERSDRFNVEVTLDPSIGSFVIVDIGSTEVGLDHDNCLANNEVYAVMNVPEDTLKFEPVSGESDNSNDDCVRSKEEK